MIMGQGVKQSGDGTWETPGAEGIWEAVVTQSARIYIERRQATVEQWVALHPLFSLCARETGYEGGGRVERCGGAKRRRKHNFGRPWKTHRKQEVGGGEVDRWTFSRTTTIRERKSGWVIGMLRRRQATPRWANDLVCQSGMLGRRQGTPSWEDEPVWWLCRVLENLEGLGSIYNNKRQSLGFKQSLTEGWKVHLIIRSHYLPPHTS